MEKLVIEGGIPLKGSVTIGGSKNSSLPIMTACLLTKDRCIIKNVPNLRDVHTMIKILRSLGVLVEFNNSELSIEARDIKKNKADYKLVSTMRASFCVLGPLLSRMGKACVSLPGGCVIGVRPVDLHIKGIKSLGIDVLIKEGYVQASVSRRTKGAHMYLGGEFGSSVLATANIMMAATLIKGKTIIECASCEPEIEDLARFLIKMGANISGVGTPIIEIEGVMELHGVEHEVIPDRIEAGTFIIAAAITKGELTIKKCEYKHLGALIDKLAQAGLSIKRTDGSIFINGKKRLDPVSIATFPYPGFPTDMQAQFMALMSVTPGVSVITEKIYPDRFMHVAELNRMGAKILKEGPHAIVEGVKQLSAAPVMASDLRASAALVLAGLVAKGKSEISRIYHLDRGYEGLDNKLRSLGAKVWREKE